MQYCKKYPKDKVLPNKNNKCSLCGGNCTEDWQITGYNAIIQFEDGDEPQQEVLIKVGSFDEETATEQEILEDEEVFYYIDSPEQIEHLKTKGVEDFIVLSAEPIYN